MTRIANIDGRLKLALADGLVDVETASDGTFSSDPQAVYERWDEFTAWGASVTAATEPLVEDGPRWGSPVPRPPQVFALGNAYVAHADLLGLVPGSEPGVFLKLPTSIAGPFDDVRLTSATVVDEVELAVVFKRETFRVKSADVADHIAGYALSLDISDLESAVVFRTRWGGAGLTYGNFAKDRPGYTPVGPYVVTADEAGDLTNLPVESEVNGAPKFRGNTNDFVLPLEEVIAYIASRVRFLAGDLLLTGSPARLIGDKPDLLSDPLKPGDVVTARVGELGAQRKVLLPPEVIDG